MSVAARSPHDRFMTTHTIDQLAGLAYRTHGGGGPHRPPILIIHGGAEDAELLDAQAHDLAGRGRRVIWYDRRGTGSSTREDWPQGGAERHAEDAAALLTALRAGPAQVVGLSSGGVVGLMLAVRHPELVDELVLWESPVLALLPDSAAVNDAILADATTYLAKHPGDYPGAFPILMAAMGVPADELHSPRIRRLSRNAEAMIRDDAPFVLHDVPFEQVPADRITIAIGETSNALHETLADRLAQRFGRQVHRVPGAHEHEVYLSDPPVLGAWLAQRPLLHDGADPGCAVHA